jgi:ABC-type Na+ efflux pump permease subunit
VFVVCRTTEPFHSEIVIHEDDLQQQQQQSQQQSQQQQQQQQNNEQAVVLHADAVLDANGERVERRVRPLATPSRPDSFTKEQFFTPSSSPSKCSRNQVSFFFFFFVFLINFFH